MVSLSSNHVGPLAVVDDEHDSLVITERAFTATGSGVELLRFTSGSDFLVHIEERSAQGKTLPARVLLDINMAAPDGFEVLQRMQADSRFRDIPVIMLTSSNDPDHMRKARQFGAAGYQVKPFGFTQYIEFLKEQLGSLEMKAASNGRG